MYLLAQFRERAAYPMLVKLFSTPGEVCFDVAGDLVIEPPEVSLVQYPALVDHINRMQGCELPDALSGTQTRCREPEDLAHDAAELDLVIDLETIRNARIGPGVDARAAAPALPSQPEIPAAKPVQTPP